jgi:hypothetical protein
MLSDEFWLDVRKGGIVLGRGNIRDHVQYGGNGSGGGGR